MPLSDLLFSFNGVIGRLSFWLGNLILAVVALALLLILLPVIDPNADWQQLGATADGTHALALTQLVAFLAVVYPSLAVTVKRLNDIGASPLQTIVYFAPWLLTIVIDLLVLGGPMSQRNSLGTAADLVSIFVSLLYLYDLGLRPKPGGRWFA